MSVNQHAGICNGKVCELNAANTDLAYFEHGHINVGPEFDVVNREAFLAGYRPGAPGEFGSGTQSESAVDLVGRRQVCG